MDYSIVWKNIDGTLAVMKLAEMDRKEGEDDAAFLSRIMKKDGKPGARIVRDADLPTDPDFIASKAIEAGRGVLDSPMAGMMPDVLMAMAGRLVVLQASSLWKDIKKSDKDKISAIIDAAALAMKAALNL